MGLESQPINRHYKYDDLEPIPNHYGLCVVAFSMLIFFIINRIVHILGPPKPIPSKDAWKWTNLFCSWVHALIVGSWDLSCFFLYPEMVVDLVGYHDMYCYMMIAVSTGYFFYDFVDVLVSRRGSTGWEILLHHVAVAGTFFYNLMVSHCIAYTVVALLAEVNSFFLHSRKLMQMVHVPFDALIYRINVYFNLVSFITCRFFAMMWIMYGMCMWYDRVSRAYFVLLSFAMFVMWFINIILFCRLLSNDLLRKSKTKSCRQSNGVKISANNNGPIHNQNGAYDKPINNHADTTQHSTPTTLDKCHIGNGYKPKMS